jgi:WD40 repeat protein
MWSITTYRPSAGSIRVACGAADSKLTTHPLVGVNQQTQGVGITTAEYTMQDLLHTAQPETNVEKAQQSTKASKKADSIRSYCFISSRMFLLVTNSGKILIESLRPENGSSLQSTLTKSILVSQLEDLAGYSTCASVSDYGVAFLAGTQGNIYMCSEKDSIPKKIHTVASKVGSLFATNMSLADGRKQLVLLVTLVGQKQAELLFIDITKGLSTDNIQVLLVPVSDILTGSAVTSMCLVETDVGNSVLFLGFRRGSIGMYAISQDVSSLEARLFRVIEKVHGDETVTAISFKSLPDSESSGYLYSVGRNGCLAVHMIGLVKDYVEMVHNLTLPIGPNIEDLYFWQDHLLVHGFSSKKWILYDITSEEEIMGIETGGAHRSWAFQPSQSPYNLQGGTLVWTRTSSLHICSQEVPNHDVLRTGAHGREVKAVAVSPPRDCSVCCVRHQGLIATGAEDTDIKIFQYVKGELVCRRTLRKHTTGIQHLQWSDDGKYLFSSAGSEEFYIWRVRFLETTVSIGVVCEYVYSPESEFSDLRIMSFDVTRQGSAYTIAMVFSDSSIKVSIVLLVVDPSLILLRRTATIRQSQRNGSLWLKASTSLLASHSARSYRPQAC